MKIISVRQPWASLIINGAKNVRTGAVERKDIENRDWRTHHRGPVLIHASQRRDDTIAESDLIRRYGVKMPKEMPCGGVIGMVDIVDCVDTHPSKWFVGEYGFTLKNPRRLKFQPWQGQLGLKEAPRALLTRCNLTQTLR